MVTFCAGTKGENIVKENYSETNVFFLLFSVDIFLPYVIYE